MRRLLGRERGGRHPRLGVRLQKDSPARPLRLVPAEVGPAHAPAPERPVRAQRIVEAGRLDLRRNLRRASRGAIRPACTSRHSRTSRRSGCRSRPAPGRPSPWSSVPAPAHRPRPSRPRASSRPKLRRRIRPLAHDVDADRRAFVVRLHHVGRRQHMPRLDLVARRRARSPPPAARRRDRRPSTAALSIASAEASTPECV